MVGCCAPILVFVNKLHPILPQESHNSLERTRNFTRHTTICRYVTDMSSTPNPLKMIVDPILGKASYSFVAGKIIMLAGRVIVSGGTIFTIERGVSAVDKSGIPHEIVNLTKAMVYAGKS